MRSDPHDQNRSRERELPGREAVAMICATMMRLAIRPQITTTAIAVSGDTAILLVSASTALTLPFATEKKLRLKRNFCQRPNRNNFPA